MTHVKLYTLRAMKQACYIVKHMLGHNAYLREVIYKNNVAKIQQNYC